MSIQSPVSILYDANGNPVEVVNDGGVYRIRTSAKIDSPLPAGTNNIGDVDVVSSALPTGAATEATLATIATESKLEAVRALVASLEAKDFATQTTLVAADAKLATIDAVLDAIKDTAGIKKITDPLPAGTNNIGDVDVVSSALPTGAATEATLATLATETKLEAVRVLLASLDGKDFATQTTLLAADGRLTTIDSVLDSIKDTDGIKKITDELPAGTQEIGSVKQGTKAADAAAWPIKLTNAAGDKVATLTDDAGIIRQEIVGKVSVVGATAPPSTTAQEIFADTPLKVGTHDTVFTIPDGETFHLQNITAGNEDPSKGAVIAVIFDNGSEHVVERVYTNGSTVSISFNDVATSRDGIALLGNGAGTSDIIIRRTKYAGTDIAIDALITGYTA